MFTRPKGFTLIELLVVVAIIALLMAIVMPGLGGVQQAARDTVCASQLRQWGVAFHAYAADHQNKPVPSWQISHRENRDPLHWFKSLEDYVGEVESGGSISDLIACPQTDGAVSSDLKKLSMGTVSRGWWFGRESHANAPKHLAPDSDGVNGGYGYSNYWEGTKINADGFNTLAMAEDPTNTPVFMDATWADLGWPTDNTTLNVDKFLTEDTTWRNARNMDRITISRHGVRGSEDPSSTGVNFVMADGSAKYVPAIDYYSLQWHRNFKTRETP